MTRQTLSATTLVGDGVRNTDGEDLGKVKDIMIDLDAGMISYAVLDMGGFLGIGNRLFAVPWNSLKIDTDAHELVLDVAKETLDNAPGFDQDNWPDFSDRDWGAAIYRHYGTSPYWAG
jgi:sporulation protein YlmC with PRC-barrel domain